MMRFTIREVLILTVTVGLAVGWWLDRQRLTADADKWRRIAGGLEHLFVSHAWNVGQEGNRIWVGRTGGSPVLWGKVGLDEFEPTLDKEVVPPLENYYARWPRKPLDPSPSR